ncbi:MAG: phage terminase small subunit P27 family, partial [Desulfobacteraceae bacterium]
MKGRKPTPTNLKLIRGNPGRRPIDLEHEAQPEIPDRPPGPPSYLPQIA